MPSTPNSRWTTLWSVLIGNIPSAMPWPCSTIRGGAPGGAGAAKNPEIPTSTNTTPKTMAIVAIFIGPPLHELGGAAELPQDSVQSGFLMHNLERRTEGLRLPDRRSAR